MKFIAIGELMLRLSPPNYEKIVSTHNYIANYGGAESNVAVSLANLGVDSTFFTVLPNSDIGKSAINYLKSNDKKVYKLITLRKFGLPLQWKSEFGKKIIISGYHFFNRIFGFN